LGQNDSKSRPLAFFQKIRAQFGDGGDTNAEIIIIRQTEKGRQRISANEDTELTPGDAVKVALDTSQLLSFMPN
jgi:hypothetical protein